LANNRPLIEVPEDEKKDQEKVPFHIRLRWYDEIAAEDQTERADDNATKPKRETIGP
jgi:hypothetical protein